MIKDLDIIFRPLASLRKWKIRISVVSKAITGSTNKIWSLCLRDLYIPFIVAGMIRLA